MTSAKFRILLGSAVVLLATVIALLTVGLLDNRSSQRAAADQRLDDAAGVTASVTGSIFSSSSAQAAERNALTFGSPTVSLKSLNERVRKDRATYAVVLDAGGTPLAVTPGTTPGVLRALGDQPDHIRRVLDGEDYRLSDVLGEVTLEYASGFETPGGDRRVLVEGFPVSLLSTFLAAYFRQLPEADRQRGYILDGAGRVVATTSGDTLGERVALDVPGRRLADAGITGTDWRVVLSLPVEVLYRDVSSAVQWLVLLALAIAGVGIVILFVRLMRRDIALSTALGDLEHANAELRRSNAELEHFAAVASHDLQEPLRKVQGFGDQLAARFGDDLPVEGRDYLQRMRSAAGRMSTLIDDLLRLSRVTTHAKPPERVDLTQLAQEVVHELEVAANVMIEPLPAVDADPVQVRQLLQNLITNGLKFRRPGVEPLVRLQPRPGRTRRHAAFAVTDNGIGFEPAYAERIFGVFERLNARDEYPGTGIGLAICRRIVERNGGSITAEGHPGEGAVFLVNLPAAAAAAAAAPALAEQQREATHA